MILLITHKCSMECTHCCLNSQKDGKHMTKEVFLKALDFYDRFLYKIMIVSGGEPTEHPNFEEYMDIILKRGYNLIILSNGIWTLDERKDRYLSKYQFQIINDQRYYSKHIPVINHPNILVFGKVENPISKCTRSIKNNIYTKHAPKCFNLRSISKIQTSFAKVLYGYTLYLNKFCSPLIKWDGSIILGESDLCKPFGTIYDSDQTLLSNMKNFKCNNCGCFDNIDYKLRLYLGE